MHLRSKPFKFGIALSGGGARGIVLIGVHVNHNGPEESISGIKAIAERTFRLAMSQNVRGSLAKCDFVIEPPETRQYNTFDFKKADEIFRIGFEETEKRILEMFDSIDLEQVIQEKMSRTIKNI